MSWRNYPWLRNLHSSKTTFAFFFMLHYAISGSKSESTALSFGGNGWADISNIDRNINILHAKIEVVPQSDSGLIFYYGPLSYEPGIHDRDFVSLEIIDGYAVFYLVYGNHTVKFSQLVNKLMMGKSHTITIKREPNTISIYMSSCLFHFRSTVTLPYFTNGKPSLPNYPLQMGGIRNYAEVQKLSNSLRWGVTPSNQGFKGCVKNLEINGRTINLAATAHAQNVRDGC